jgi:signal transduction histidine kinase/ligand-binding sensor domain-containing protein
MNAYQPFSCPDVWFARGLRLMLILFSLLFHPFLCTGQDTMGGNPYYIQTWTAEDGLPENRVVGISQTDDGYLWVLTRGGLVRFDGAQFQPFEAASSAGFVTSTMWNLYKDRQNRLWVAKEHGTIVCIAGTNLFALTAKDGLPPFGGECSLSEDVQSNLWISYPGSILRYQNGQVEDLTSRCGLPASGDCLFITDRDGKLWFAEDGKVGLLRNGTFVTLLNFQAHIIQIAPARSGGVWICAGQRVMHFLEGQPPVTLATLPKIRATAEPSALMEDDQGVVWVGTPDGLFRCDSNGVETVETSSPIISCLAEDREGGLWVGTGGGGLNRIQLRVISLIGTQMGLPFEGVRSICQDSLGTIWAVGINNVLARRDGNQWNLITVDTNYPDTHSTCVTADTKGNVWVGTDYGKLYRLDHGNFLEVELGNSNQARTLRSLYVTAGNDLWVAADSAGTNNFLCRIRNDAVQTFDLPPGYRIVRAMTEDAAGNFWAGGSDGLLVRVAGDTLVDESAQYPKFSIRCLLGTADGSLWIGYAGFGVGQLLNGHYSRFGTDQGLPNEYVSQILSDEKGGLWFAGNRGIFEIPQKNFDEIESGREPLIQPILYGRGQELPNLQASFDFCPNAMRGQDGRLYFSTLTGLAEVNTSRTRTNQVPPAVIISRVVADNQIFAAYQNVTAPTGAVAILELDCLGQARQIFLPPGVQNIQIDYTALSFVTPENVRFRYELEGVDRSWVDAGTQRVAQYTHLSPGRYNFHVIACNNGGVWNDTGATVDLVMEPHLWETLWFKTLVVTGTLSIMCGSLVLILRRRHRLQIQYLERQQALERERSRIARDLHDDLGIGLTEIGLLGDLASAPNSSGNGETNRAYLNEIVDRARELVVLLDEIVWAINPANDTSRSLSDYFLKYAQTLLHRASIRCRLDVTEPFPNCGLNADERHQLFLAFKEALNNVIRHSGASEVQIGLGILSHELTIKVQDNGRGLKAAETPGSRDGLHGMQERLRQLGGRCEIAENVDGGTCVRLIIPVCLPKNL